MIKVKKFKTYCLINGRCGPDACDGYDNRLINNVTIENLSGKRSCGRQTTAGYKNEAVDESVRPDDSFERDKWTVLAESRVVISAFKISKFAGLNKHFNITKKKKP